MWAYQKRLQYPINITKKDLRMAKLLVTQYGGTYYKRDINYSIILKCHFYNHILFY